MGRREEGRKELAAVSPPLVVRLQRARLLLSPEHHRVHHTPPGDRHYCIATGWCDAPLEWIGVFERLERVLRAPGARPSRPGGR